MADALRTYLTEQFDETEGWCAPHLWQAIEPLAAEMKSDGAPAPVAEIGVLFGKFFIGLVHTMEAQAHNAAIDIFEWQQFNLDRAGKGDRARFEANLARCGIAPDRVDIHQRDTMGLTDDDAAHFRKVTGGGFAMFSIDGCHTAEHTVNDLEFAMKTTRADGIIFVDDYYNSHWPGVHEGVAKVYLTGTPRFVPLVYTSNKLLLCNISCHARYQEAVIDHVKAHHSDSRLVDHARYGYRCPTILPDHENGAVLSEA